LPLRGFTIYRVDKGTSLKFTWLRHLCVLSALLVGFSATATETSSACPTAPKTDAKTLKRLSGTPHPDRGPLWEFSKDGHRSFLYGTVHVAKLEWDFPGATVAQALGASRQLMVELDLSDPMLAKRMQDARRRVLGEPNGTAPEDNALVARVSRQFKQACIDEAIFSEATLASKVLWLSMQSARDKGLYPDFAIEAALGGYARANGKPVVELETPDEQTQALSSGTGSTEENLTALENGATRRQLIQLTSAWAAGDLARLERDFQDQLGTTHLVSDRNAVLADRIARAHETRDGVFAAIGVLHMVGPGNVPERLERMGYSVRPLTGALEDRRLQ